MYILNTWIPDSMNHNQAFVSLVFSPPSTWPFDKWTQIYHLNTGLAQYSDGYCIKIPSVVFMYLFIRLDESSDDAEAGQAQVLERPGLQKVENTVGIQLLALQLPESSS